MKNIQVIDDAVNCTYSIFQATASEFDLIFAGPGQDIEFIEDLAGLPNWREIDRALHNIYDRPIRKRDALGIHGTLFYQMERLKSFYPEKRESAVKAAAINKAQRRLFSDA